jgi:hypothetical protein
LKLRKVGERMDSGLCADYRQPQDDPHPPEVDEGDEGESIEPCVLAENAENSRRTPDDRQSGQAVSSAIALTGRKSVNRREQSSHWYSYRGITDLVAKVCPLYIDPARSFNRSFRSFQ